jgi:RNA polymerase sigma-70 factor (ECF subfamily)
VSKLLVSDVRPVYTRDTTFNLSNSIAVTDANNVLCSSSAGAPASTPSSLVAGLKAQDPVAWQRLAFLYAPVVMRWCLQRGLQANDADDVLQEVFRTVLSRIGDFRRQGPQDTFRGWLWAITRHKLGDHFRNAARPEAAIGKALDDLPGVVDAPSIAEVDPLFQRALESVRGQFEATTWQAFWSVVVEERVPAVVAAELGLSPNAVYLARSRVLRRLREELGDVE